MTYDHPAAGLAAVNAMRAATNGDTPAGRPLARHQVTEEWIADTIADLLHLADFVGYDPDEVLDHGRTYYEADGEFRAEAGCEHRRWVNLVCLDCGRPVPAMAGSLADTWREGTPDPTAIGNTDQECGATRNSFVCTWRRHRDHPDLHVAGTGSIIAAVWPVEDDQPAPPPITDPWAIAPGPTPAF